MKYWIAVAIYALLACTQTLSAQIVGFEANPLISKNNQNFLRSQAAVVQITSQAIEGAPSARLR
jgi:hypothetical protein